jgi:hypothetical protein
MNFEFVKVFPEIYDELVEEHEQENQVKMLHFLINNHYLVNEQLVD